MEFLLELDRFVQILESGNWKKREFLEFWIHSYFVLQEFFHS